MADIRASCGSRMCGTEKRSLSGSMTASHSRPSTGGPLASLCRISISGSRPSGYVASDSWRTTSPDSGKSTDITATEIRGANSGTTVTRVPRPVAWQAARVISIREETHRAKTIRLLVSNWPGHLAGQHADVRLTADDGYRAERSYSIASPPEVSELELTVDRLDNGEVSPFLTGQLRPDDTIELRGPIGGHFVWSAFERRRPLLLFAGGSGVVPLMCMLRHRKLSSSVVPAVLLYSARTREDVIYHQELTA